MNLRPPRKPLGVDSVIKVLATPASVSETSETLIDVSTAGRPQQSVGIFCALLDDVYDRVHCIGAPDRATGPPYDFDPLDLFEQCVLHLPKNTPSQRPLHAPPLHV